MPNLAPCQIDMGSSLNLSATVEALMLGIVMGRAPRLLKARIQTSWDSSAFLLLGTVPITVFGLFVSAPWLAL